MRKVKMDKPTSERLVKIGDYVYDQLGKEGEVGGLAFIRLPNGSWTCSAYVKTSDGETGTYSGVAETPQDAYIKLLHRIAGTEEPPF